MAEISNNNVEDIVEEWDHPIDPSGAENLHKLLSVVASENARLDVELEEIYDNRFLDTATGANLQKIGDFVGIDRKANEDDPKLRKRIRGAFAAQASDTTYNSFTSATLSILEASPNQIEFITPPETNPKVVEIQLDGSVLDASPLTENELIILLNGALSADARAQIKNIGTFAFAGDDSSLEGFNEGTWSVGVN